MSMRLAVVKNSATKCRNCTRPLAVNSKGVLIHNPNAPAAAWDLRQQWFHISCVARVIGIAPNDLSNVVMVASPRAQYKRRPVDG